MFKSLFYNFMALIFLSIATSYSSAEIPLFKQSDFEGSELIEIAKKR